LFIFAARVNKKCVAELEEGKKTTFFWDITFFLAILSSWVGVNTNKGRMKRGKKHI
jgi:hypothetical protein